MRLLRDLGLLAVGVLLRHELELHPALFCALVAAVAISMGEFVREQGGQR